MAIRFLSSSYITEVFKSPFFSYIVYIVAGGVIGRAMGMLASGRDTRKKHLATASAVLGAIAGLSLATLGTVYDLARNWLFLLIISFVFASFFWRFMDGFLFRETKKHYSIPIGLFVMMLIWFVLSRVVRGRTVEDIATTMFLILIVAGIIGALFAVIWFKRGRRAAMRLETPADVERAQREFNRLETDIDRRFNELLNAVNRVNTGVEEVEGSVTTLSSKVDDALKKLDDWKTGFLQPNEQKLNQITNMVARTYNLTADQKDFLQTWKGQFDNFETFVRTEVTELRDSVNAVIEGMSHELESLREIHRDQRKLVDDFDEMKRDQQRFGEELKRQLAGLPAEVQGPLLEELDKIWTDLTQVYEELSTEHSQTNQAINEVKSRVESTEQTLLKELTDKVEKGQSDIQKQIVSVKEGIGKVLDTQKRIQVDIQSAQSQLLQRINAAQANITREADVHKKEIADLIRSVKAGIGQGIAKGIAISKELQDKFTALEAGIVARTVTKEELQQALANLQTQITDATRQGISAAKGELSTKLREILTATSQISSNTGGLSQYMDDTKGLLDSFRTELGSIKQLAQRASTATSTARTRRATLRQRQTTLQQKVRNVILGKDARGQVTVNIGLIKEAVAKLKPLVEQLEQLGIQPAITEEQVKTVKATLRAIESPCKSLKNLIVKIDQYSAQWPDLARTYNLHNVRTALVAAAEDNGALQIDLTNLKAAVTPRKPDLAAVRQRLFTMSMHKHAEKLVLPAVPTLPT